VERSETNNSASVNVTVNGPIPRPDLVISSLTGTSAASRGGQASYTAQVSNVGQAPASGVNLRFMGGSSPWTLASSSGAAGLVPCVRVFDELDWDVHCPTSSGGISLAPNQSATVTIVMQIPNDWPVGTIYVYATADPANQVVESNDSNNNSSFFATSVS